MFALAVNPYLLLTADPFGSLLALKIEHHSYLKVLELGHRLIAVMIGDEPIQPKAQFICKDEIVLPQQQFLKLGLILGIQVILDDIIAVDFCEEVMRVLEFCCLLEGLLILLLSYCYIVRMLNFWGGRMHIS